MKCLNCNVEITSFTYYETVCQRGTFDGSKYSELKINYTYDTEYCCPHCNAHIYDNEEEARLA